MHNTMNEQSNDCSNLSFQEVKPKDVCIETPTKEEIISTTQSLDSNEADNAKVDTVLNNIETTFSEHDILIEESSKCPVASTSSSTHSNFKTCHSIDKSELDEESPDHIDSEPVYPEPFKRPKLELYGEVTGPCMYDVDCDCVTKPLIANNLPAAFEELPLTGRPEGNETVKEHLDKKLKEFVGSHLSDSEFEKLSKYCSIENLKTGYELVMESKIPALGVCPPAVKVPPGCDKGGDLVVNKKYKMRDEPEDPRYLKYRGARIIETPKQEDGPLPHLDELLEPGKDLIYRVRVYRPFPSQSHKISRMRPSLVLCDVVLCGRQPLHALRDRVVCINDADLRLDVSDNPDVPRASTAKEMFPSGFLFINNVFYVDRRAGRRDLTAGVRRWARERRLGHFPARDMSEPLHRLPPLRLGHPEVYIHQGNCEHLLTFSSVRVATAADPLRLSSYPYTTLVSSNQTVYCTTCAEFGAKWIVTGSNRVPFDPAFFCDTCLKLYMYKDGKKIGDFKAFSYKGNEINLLKPMSE